MPKLSFVSTLLIAAVLGGMGACAPVEGDHSPLPEDEQLDDRADRPGVAFKRLATSGRSSMQPNFSSPAMGECTEESLRLDAAILAASLAEQLPKRAVRVVEHTFSQPDKSYLVDLENSAASYAALYAPSMRRLTREGSSNTLPASSDLTPTSFHSALASELGEGFPIAISTRSNTGGCALERVVGFNSIVQKSPDGSSAQITTTLTFASATPAETISYSIVLDAEGIPSGGSFENPSDSKRHVFVLRANGGLSRAAGVSLQSLRAAVAASEIACSDPSGETCASVHTYRKLSSLRFDERALNFSLKIEESNVLHAFAWVHVTHTKLGDVRATVSIGGRKVSLAGFGGTGASTSGHVWRNLQARGRVDEATLSIEDADNIATEEIIDRSGILRDFAISIVR